MSALATLGDFLVESEYFTNAEALRLAKLAKTAIGFKGPIKNHGKYLEVPFENSLGATAFMRIAQKRTRLKAKVYDKSVRVSK